jgi:hypothetical protein
MLTLDAILSVTRHNNAFGRDSSEPVPYDHSGGQGVRRIRLSGEGDAVVESATEIEAGEDISLGGVNE